MLDRDRIDGWLERIAAEAGTPAYVYFTEAIAARIADLRAAFGGRFALSYAVKANPNPALLAWLADRIEALDVSSIGEYRLAAAAGWDPAPCQLHRPRKARSRAPRGDRHRHRRAHRRVAAGGGDRRSHRRRPRPRAGRARPDRPVARAEGLRRPDGRSTERLRHRHRGCRSRPPADPRARSSARRRLPHLFGHPMPEAGGAGRELQDLPRNLLGSVRPVRCPAPEARVRLGPRHPLPRERPAAGPRGGSRRNSVGPRRVLQPAGKPKACSSSSSSAAIWSERRATS